MIVARLVVCAVLALPAGWFAGLLVDRVPDRLPLWEDLPGIRAHGKYLAVHVVMLVLFVLAALRFEDQSVWMLGCYLLFFAMLLTVSVIDIELYRLPDLIVLPSLLASLILVVVVSLVDGAGEQVRYALIGGALYFGLLLIAHLISPRGMGFGDVKLAAVMGLYVGWLGSSGLEAVVLILWSMLIGFVAGSIIGIVMLAARRRSQPIPFGPFLALGAVATCLLSTGIVSG